MNESLLLKEVTEHLESLRATMKEMEADEERDEYDCQNLLGWIEALEYVIITAKGPEKKKKKKK